MRIPKRGSLSGESQQEDPFMRIPAGESPSEDPQRGIPISPMIMRLPIGECLQEDPSKENPSKENTYRRFPKGGSL